MKTLPFRISCTLVLLTACVDLEPQAELQRSSAAPDIVLDATWEPASGDVIDCGGAAIRPRIPASENGGLSVPDTLIFLGPGVVGVHIKNCTLEATFPVVAMGGGFHHITGNVIRASGAGVSLFSSDGNLLHDNVMSARGRNVQVRNDSDGTVVWENDISHEPVGQGVDGISGLTFPEEPGGVGVGTFSYPGVTNVIVNGRLVQDVTTFGTQPEGTLVLGNSIHNQGGELGIIFATRSSHAYSEGNHVVGGELGLAVFGYDDFSWFLEAGTCSGDPTMFCVDSGDPYEGCALPGLEPRGTCDGTGYVMGGGRVVAPAHVGNRVEGAVIGVLAGFTDGFRAENNDLRGGYAGLLLWGYVLHEGSVHGNVAVGNQVGLILEDDNFNPVAVGLDLSHNDLGANQRAFDAYSLVFDPETWEVVDVVPFAKPAVLPDNWWGGACEFPANPEWWPEVEAGTLAARPIARAWRDGVASDVPSCRP